MRRKYQKLKEKWRCVSVFLSRDCVFVLPTISYGDGLIMDLDLFSGENIKTDEPKKEEAKSAEATEVINM